MPNKDWVAKEMARRYIQFHYDKPWRTIKLWGLFTYPTIKAYLQDGRLINYLNYTPENHTYWVIPSEAYYENSILPEIRQTLIDKL